MTRRGWLLLGGLLVLIVGILIAVFFLRHSVPSVSPEQQTATSTAEVNPATLSIYTNGEYGFSLFYPSSSRVSDAYSTTALSGVPWRAHASDQGTAIVRIQSDTEELRVGKSSEAGDVRNCLESGPAEESAGPLTVGSTTWRTFTSQKLGTDNEQRVTSYRTVRKSSCYALELFQPKLGSATSTSYTLADTIKSFTFAD